MDLQRFFTISHSAILTILCGYGSMTAVLIGLKQVQENGTSRIIGLGGDLHNDEDADPEEMRTTNAMQLSALQAALLEREANEKTPLHVMVEAPFQILNSPYKLDPSCLRNMLDHTYDRRYKLTDFENIEQRKFSAAAIFLSNKNRILWNLNSDQQYVFNDIGISLKGLMVKEVQSEHNNMLRFIENNKILFNDISGSSESMIRDSQKARKSFDSIVTNLKINPLSTVVEFIEAADEINAETYSIDSQYKIADEQNMRPSLRLMLKDMVNPLFDLFLYSRIKNSDTNQLFLTGASHSERMYSLMKESEKFTLKMSRGAFWDHKSRITKGDIKLLSGTNKS